MGKYYNLPNVLNNQLETDNTSEWVRSIKNGWKSARQRIESYSLNLTGLGNFYEMTL